MYELLDSVNPIATRLLSGLHPLSAEEVNALKDGFPSLPHSYFRFMEERGAGAIVESAESFDHIRFLKKPLDAEREYYLDRQIHEDSDIGYGAQGPLMIFATDSTGIAYGFESGDSMKIVEIDNARRIRRLHLSFEEFATGVISEYPEIPSRNNA